MARTFVKFPLASSRAVGGARAENRRALHNKKLEPADAFAVNLAARSVSGETMYSRSRWIPFSNSGEVLR